MADEIDFDATADSNTDEATGSISFQVFDVRGRSKGIKNLNSDGSSTAEFKEGANVVRVDRAAGQLDVKVFRPDGLTELLSPERLNDLLARERELFVLPKHAYLFK